MTSTIGANIIVVTKPDLVNQGYLQALKSLLHTMNPSAEIYVAENGHIDVSKFKS